MVVSGGLAAVVVSGGLEAVVAVSVVVVHVCQEGWWWCTRVSGGLVVVHVCQEGWWWCTCVRRVGGGSDSRGGGKS